MTELETSGETQPNGSMPAETSSEAPVATAAGVSEWTADLPEDARGFVKNKGWAKPADLLDSYRHLERLVGAERLALPRDENDRANWERVWNRLGRPEKPEGYKLPLPEKGGDKALAKAFAARAHDLGLTAKQARGLTDWWNADGQGRARPGRAPEAGARGGGNRDAAGRARHGVRRRGGGGAARGATLFGFDAET